MSYEIPKNLKYEEKIIFNLSLWQACSLGLFGMLAAAVFLKTSMALELKAGMALALALAGIGFAFFDLMGHASGAAGFLIRPRAMGYLCGEMQKFVEVKSIRENAIFLNNGAIKAIVQVWPINFRILSARQQEAIISAYKDFLNSLDFPVQIVMRTVNLSLDEYLEHMALRVKKTKNVKLQARFAEFRDFMKSYIEQHAVKNRLFYIAIPADEKSEKNALSQLDIRTKLCHDKLKKCGLYTKRLEDRQLTTMLSSYFEGFIENRNEYQTVVTLLEKNMAGEGEFDG